MWFSNEEASKNERATDDDAIVGDGDPSSCENEGERVAIWFFAYLSVACEFWEFLIASNRPIGLSQCRFLIAPVFDWCITHRPGMTTTLPYNHLNTVGYHPLDVVGWYFHFGLQTYHWIHRCFATSENHVMTPTFFQITFVTIIGGRRRREQLWTAAQLRHHQSIILPSLLFLL